MADLEATEDACRDGGPSDQDLVTYHEEEDEVEVRTGLTRVVVSSHVVECEVDVRRVGTTADRGKGVEEASTDDVRHKVLDSESLIRDEADVRRGLQEAAGRGSCAEEEDWVIVDDQAVRNARGLAKYWLQHWLKSLRQLEEEASEVLSAARLMHRSESGCFLLVPPGFPDPSASA